jgi:hypothetical protein
LGRSTAGPHVRTIQIFTRSFPPPRILPNFRCTPRRPTLRALCAPTCAPSVVNLSPFARKNENGETQPTFPRSHNPRSNSALTPSSAPPETPPSHCSSARTHP